MAQDTTGQSFRVSESINLEFGGRGLVYSINYDLLLNLPVEYVKISSGLGIGYLAGEEMKDLFIPIHLTGLLGKSPLFFEAGLLYLPNRYWRRGSRHPEFWRTGTNTQGFLLTGIRYYITTSRPQVKLEAIISDNDIAASTWKYQIWRYVPGHPKTQKPGSVVWPGASVGYTF